MNDWETAMYLKRALAISIGFHVFTMVSLSLYLLLIIRRVI